MRLLYSLGILLFGFGIRLASIGNEKAKQWVDGRKNWKSELKKLQDLKGCIWFHCASLGEFEQGRPLLEKIKDKYPIKPILLTFYSPSGYLVRKNYAYADSVIYLPLDTPANAKFFLDTVRPDMAIFVKYEVWHNFFKGIATRDIPLLMISAIFRQNQIYFKPYGKWFRKSLQYVKTIFTQDEKSLELLQNIGLKNTVLAGDTRFDRVIEISKKTENFPELEKFAQGKKTIVAGSTWPADENLLAKYAATHPEIQLIIAPHEIGDTHIKAISEKFPKSIKWSEKDQARSGNVIIIDCIGLLSAIYKYGNVAYVGGGFGSGIHNTLEPAVYGMPVLFGPAFSKFREAVGLCEVNGAKSISNYSDLEKIINHLFSQAEFRKEMGKAAGKYVVDNAGATDVILKEIDGLLG